MVLWVILLRSMLRTIRTKESSIMVELKELVDSYAQHNEDYNALKKIVDKEGKEIKERFALEDISEMQGDGFKVSVSIRTTETLLEDKLLVLLKNSDIDPDVLTNVVKTKEYIDMDALESAIYKGDITENIVATFDVCREVKETQVLKVTRDKKKKGA